MFTLNPLIELSLMLKKENLLCMYVTMYGENDYGRSGITGKWFNVIVKMYSECKWRIAVNNNFSAYFQCKIEVQQGENLTPFLFALFFNS